MGLLSASAPLEKPAVTQQYKNLPGAKQTLADNCSVFVIEKVITDCSPLTAVVDFQTSFMRQTTACQSHCQQEHETDILTIPASSTSIDLDHMRQLNSTAKIADDLTGPLSDCKLKLCRHELICMTLLSKVDVDDVQEIAY